LTDFPQDQPFSVHKNTGSEDFSGGQDIAEGFVQTSEAGPNPYLTVFHPGFPVCYKFSFTTSRWLLYQLLRIQ